MGRQRSVALDGAIFVGDVSFTGVALCFTPAYTLVSPNGLSPSVDAKPPRPTHARSITRGRVDGSWARGFFSFSRFSRVSR